MRRAVPGLVLLALAAASPAAASWLARMQDGGAFGYDAASLATDAEGHTRITAGFYTRSAVDLGGHMANFVIEDAKFDCAGDKVLVAAYAAYDDNLAPLASAPGGVWHATKDEPLLAQLKPMVCEGKPLEGAVDLGNHEAALRKMKSLGPHGGAPANPDATRLAAALSRHLNAHGKSFVATEAQRLAIGDASESGAKDDVREACPQPQNCFDFNKLTAEELMAAMQLLVQQRSAQQMQNDLKQRIQIVTERNASLQRLSSELAKAGDDKTRETLKSQIDHLNADSQRDMISIQSLTNKRNQAFDMLSDLLNKHQKALDGIVGNMR